MTIPQRNVKYLHSLLELLHEVQNAEISCRKAAKEIILANNKNTAPDGGGAQVYHHAAKRLLKAYHDQVVEGDEEEAE